MENQLIPIVIQLSIPNFNKCILDTLIGLSIDNCLQKIILYLKEHLIMNIDYPSDLDDFTNLYWYNNNAMNNEIFNYSIFVNNRWETPWTNQEIYEHFLDYMHQSDITNAIINYNDDDD